MVRFEEELKNKIKSLELRYYVAFFSTVICGLGAHIYHLTNKLFNYDELGQTPAGYGAGIELGRWGLWIIDKTIGTLFRSYNMPVVSGMMMIILTAFAVCILIKTFEIKDVVCCGLLGGSFVVFPAFVSVMFFMMMTSCHGIAIFCGCLAGYLITKGTKERRIVQLMAGFVLFLFSMGIYQAYCALVLGVLLVDIIVAFCDTENDDEWKILIMRGIAYCVVFLLGIIIYILISKGISNYSGIELGGYRNIKEMGNFNIGAIIFTILKTYREYFAIMSSHDIYQINPVVPSRILYIIINVVVLVLLFKRIKKEGALLNKIGLVLSIALMPIMIFFPEILVQGEGGYTTMFICSAFIFIIPIVLYDRYAREIRAGQNDYIGRTLCLALFCNILIYIWFANGNYQALQYTTYHDLAYFETLATQVKSLDGYTPDLKVALVGDGFEDPTFKAGSLMGEFFNISGKTETNVNYFNNIYLWKSYLGFTPEIIEFRDSGYLSEMDEVKAMPCYPEDGSIAIVGDTVVIKASE